MQMLDCLRRAEFGLNSHDRCLVALLSCVAFAHGCCTTTGVPVPQCPEPRPEMLFEISEGRVPWATEEYIARVENLCGALRVLEEGD